MHPGLWALAALVTAVASYLAFWIADRSVRASSEQSATEIVRARYDRIAPLYDLLEFAMEFRFRRWRRQLWQSVGDEQVLEVGIGTGKNLPFWPATGRVLGTDISQRMLHRARRRARRLGIEASLEMADVQALPYDDNHFDIVVGTFLFCSVPDPILGLREIRRVLKPGGRLLLVEHVLSTRPVIRFLLRLFDPISCRIWGAHLDRNTVQNVRSAGFGDLVVTPLWLDVVVRIEAKKTGAQRSHSELNSAAPDSTRA